MSSSIFLPDSPQRRQFVMGAAASLLTPPLSWSQPQPAPADAPPGGNRFDLDLVYREVNFTGRQRPATTINGLLPGPVLRWKQGQRVTLKVNNHLATDSSIHWHGIILPTEMDGVPGISFAGIPPGGSYEYCFDVEQSGTYWYHSHSGFQEQTGMYGAIVVDPAEPDPIACDRDYVIMLSDWSDEKPENIYAKLKKSSEYYNFRRRTAADLWREIRQHGVAETHRRRAMWNQMRMSDRDISDVTGYTYTFLMNGVTPEPGWLGTFTRGERVRLRIINAAAMTFFDLRIPGLKMTVVAADGQAVEPVTVDEFRIGVAETYDVIVKPKDDCAYTIFAQAIDRSGFARGTLTPNPEWRADIPAMDPAPVLTHGDMGMGHAAHAGGHGGGHQGHAMHAKMTSTKPAPAGAGSRADIRHSPTESGPQVDMRAENPMSRLDDPGIGLRDHARTLGRRVLTYADIQNLYPTPDPRDPAREVQLHLTGSMNRYMWSIDGLSFADAEPLQLKFGERLRVVLVNDTMMNHPIHLHGMWSDLETGDGRRIPRKHTVIVQPGAKLSYLVTADAPGRWAYHCHLLYHMIGMFREVRVS